MILTSDPLDILLAHDAWATTLLLEPCRPLSREEFHRRFEMGLGSLHDTFTHIIGAQRRWCDRIGGRTLRPALAVITGRADIPHDARERTPDELLALHTESAADLKAIANTWRAKLDTTISLEWPRKKEEGGGMNRYTFSRGCAITHVCTHSVHHRAQIVNMMRHLNHPGLSESANLPDPSTIDWQVAAESPPVNLP